MSEYVGPLIVLAICVALMWPIVWVWDRWIGPVVVEVLQHLEDMYVNAVVRWYEREQRSAK